MNGTGTGITTTITATAWTTTRSGGSRGGGGLGIWDGTRLYVSSNFRDAHVITTGPSIRSEFELTYDAGRGRKKSVRIETDTSHAGSNMSRV